MPSMLEAAKIRDVAARHAYVFNHGLCSPDFFDLDKRIASEEFGLIAERVRRTDDVLEIGCFTGLNLLGLAKRGHTGKLSGIDFVRGAVAWLNSHESAAVGVCGTFPTWCGELLKADAIIAYDVLEHQRNPGVFLDSMNERLKPNGTALIMVPEEKQYYDCGHVAFFPDLECLHNVLDYAFDVVELFKLQTCNKLFATCRKRGG